MNTKLVALIMSGSLLCAATPTAPALATTDDHGEWSGVITYSSTWSVDDGATEPYYDGTRTWTRTIRDVTQMTITLVDGTATASGGKQYQDLQDSRSSAPTFCTKGFTQTSHSTQTTTAGLNGPASVNVGGPYEPGAAYDLSFQGPAWQDGRTQLKGITTTDDECRPLHTREPGESTQPWGEGLDGPHAIVRAQATPDGPDVLRGSTTGTDNSGAVTVISWDLHRGCANPDQPANDLNQRLTPLEAAARTLIARLMADAAAAQVQAAALDPGQQALAQSLVTAAGTLSSGSETPPSAADFFAWLGGSQGLATAQVTAAPGLGVPVPAAADFQATLFQLQQLVADANAAMADQAQRQSCVAPESE